MSCGDTALVRGRPTALQRGTSRAFPGSNNRTTCSPQRHTECLSPPRPPGPNQPGTSGLWVHGMGKPPQYRVQRTSTDFCVPPREPFRPISTTGGLWGDGRASEAIAIPTGGPPSRIRRSKASGGGAGCRAVATRGCGAAGAFRGFGEWRNARSSSIARQRGPVDCPVGQTTSDPAPSYPNGAFYFVQITLVASLSRRPRRRGRWLSGRTWASRCSTIIMG